MFKKMFLVLMLMVLATLFIGCGRGAKDDGLHNPIDKTKIVKIGIIQIETHGALDEAREGFVAELKAEGFIEGENVEYSFFNPEGNESDLQAMARKVVRENDLVLAIATPAAIAVKAAAKNEQRRIPILFTAVTDAVDAKLVKANDHVGGRVTGTSDMNPVKEQIDLIKKLNPEFKSLGILYTVKETNSKRQADMAEKEAKKEGIKTRVGTVIGVSDIQQVLRQLMKKSDVIYIPTDNNLAKNINIVARVTREAKMPVICGEANMVKAGGLITLGINYFELGKMTGSMAGKIINGTQAKDLPVQSLALERCDLAVNVKTAKAIEITLPSDIWEKAQKFDDEE